MSGTARWSGAAVRRPSVSSPWGPDAVRVRARLGGPVLEGLPGALLDEPQVTESTVKIQDGEGRLTVGALTVEVDAEGQVRFLRTADGTELLAGRAHFWWPGPRLYTPIGAAATAWSSASPRTRARSCTASASTSTGCSTRRARSWT